MSQPVNEAGLVKRIVKAIKQEHPSAWIFNVHGGPMQMVGVPDLIICVEGKLVGAEVKFQRPGESEQHARGRASASQISQIEQIRRAGGVAGVVLSVEEALSLVRAALEIENG